jgi:hypothetical protein
LSSDNENNDRLQAGPISHKKPPDEWIAHPEVQDKVRFLQLQ